MNALEHYGAAASGQVTPDSDEALNRAKVTGRHTGAGHRERERRELIDAANREQDERDAALDLLRGPGVEWPR